MPNCSDSDPTCRATVQVLFAKGVQLYYADKIDEAADYLARANQLAVYRARPQRLYAIVPGVAVDLPPPADRGLRGRDSQRPPRAAAQCREHAREALR